MKYNPEIHHRRSIRLKGYDYSQGGLYFITLCTYHHETLFGYIKDGEMFFTDGGRIAEQCLLTIPDHFPFTELMQYVVMPNHVHFIIQITEQDTSRANNHSPLQQKFAGTSKTIGSIVRGYKIGVTKWYRTHTQIIHVWQRNYYEHIIRNEKSYNKVLEYIYLNPFNWRKDQYYT